jgi:hypothetical protein
MKKSFKAGDLVRIVDLTNYPFKELSIGDIGTIVTTDRDLYFVHFPHNELKGVNEWGHPMQRHRLELASQGIGEDHDKEMV